MKTWKKRKKWWRSTTGRSSQITKLTTFFVRARALSKSATLTDADVILERPKSSATEARRSPREVTSWPHLPLTPDRPGKTDWHLEKTLFNKRWASSREGQCCSGMSDTVFVKIRWRSWPRSEKGLDLGGIGNYYHYYWQKHLWFTRSLRDAYAVLTRMSGNNYAKHQLKITNVPSRKGIPMHRLPVTLCTCPFLICWILKYMWVPANLEQRIFSNVYKWSISIEIGKTIHTL